MINKMLIIILCIFGFASIAFSQNYMNKEILRVNWGSNADELGLFYGGPEPSHDFPRDMAIDSKGNIYKFLYNDKEAWVVKMEKVESQ